MDQTDSIELTLADVKVILRDHSQSLQKIYVSHKSVEYNFNRGKFSISKGNFDNSQVVIFLETLILCIVDFKTCNDLTVKEAQGVNLVFHLL